SERPMSPVDRRRFLTGSLGALGVGGIGAAIGAGLTEGAAASPPPSTPAALAEQVNAQALAARVTFDGSYQSGILNSRPDVATFVALDSVAPNPSVLFEALQALSTEARLLTQGQAVGVAEIDDPPPDSGILGSLDSPDSLTVTIALGGSLFDGRYGLAPKRPNQLTAMPAFAHDRLDPPRGGGAGVGKSGGGGGAPAVPPSRELRGVTEGRWVVRGTTDGSQPARRGPPTKKNRRNLFAFRDGTSNPDVNNKA